MNLDNDATFVWVLALGCLAASVAGAVAGFLAGPALRCLLGLVRRGR